MDKIIKKLQEIYNKLNSTFEKFQNANLVKPVKPISNQNKSLPLLKEEVVSNFVANHKNPPPLLKEPTISNVVTNQNKPLPLLKEKVSVSDFITNLTAYFNTDDIKQFREDINDIINNSKNSSNVNQDLNQKLTSIYYALDPKQTIYTNPSQSYVDFATRFEEQLKNLNPAGVEKSIKDFSNVTKTNNSTETSSKYNHKGEYNGIKYTINHLDSGKFEINFKELKSKNGNDISFIAQLKADMNNYSLANKHILSSEITVKWNDKGCTLTFKPFDQNLDIVKVLAEIETTNAKKAEIKNGYKRYVTDNNKLEFEKPINTGIVLDKSNIPENALALEKYQAFLSDFISNYNNYKNARGDKFSKDDYKNLVEDFEKKLNDSKINIDPRFKTFIEGLKTAKSVEEIDQYLNYEKAIIEQLKVPNANVNSTSNERIKNGLKENITANQQNDANNEIAYQNYNTAKGLYENLLKTTNDQATNNGSEKIKETDKLSFLATLIKGFTSAFNKGDSPDLKGDNVVDQDELNKFLHAACLLGENLDNINVVNNDEKNGYISLDKLQIPLIFSDGKVSKNYKCGDPKTPPK